MIDLHCHILPDLDDGATDLEDSVAMARQADADGIEVVCATPHIRHDHDVRLHELAGRVADLNRELARQGIRMRVATGGEVAETIVPQLSGEDLDAASLGGGGRWILLEPAPGPLSDTLVATVDALAAGGRGCIIAHPERHASDDLRARLAALIERGALVQVTAALLADDDAAAGMLQLAESGLVHLLASDAHTARAGRPVALSAGLAALARVEWLRPHLAWMVREAPEHVLRGSPVQPPFAPR